MHIFCALGAIMFGPSPAVHCFAVDAARLTEAREVAKAAGQGVSANDVLTPGVGNVCAPRLLTMACDFKGKIEGPTHEMAGNYHAGSMRRVTARRARSDRRWRASAALSRREPSRLLRRTQGQGRGHHLTGRLPGHQYRRL